MRQLLTVFALLGFASTVQASCLNLETVFERIANDSELKVSSGLYDIVGLDNEKIAEDLKPLFILTLSQLFESTVNSGADYRETPTRQKECAQVSMTEKTKSDDEVSYQTNVFDILDATEKKLVLASANNKKAVVTYEQILENRLNATHKTKVTVTFKCDEKLRKVSAPIEFVLTSVWSSTAQKVISPQLALALENARVELHPAIEETCTPVGIEISTAI